MHGECGGFEGGAEYSFREVHPSQSIGEKAEAGEIKPDIKELAADKGITPDSLDVRFEKMAQAMGEGKELVGPAEKSKSGIIFQQEAIKDILAMGDDNSPEVIKKAKKYWENYDRNTRLYAEVFDDKEKREKVFKEFSDYKTSIRGSLATIRFFEEKGFNFGLPSVEEDRSQKCDLFLEKLGKKGKKFNLAVQLKSHRMPALNKEDSARAGQRLLAINEYGIEKKEDQGDFNILKNYCFQLSREHGRTYFPIFVNMPVSMDNYKPGKNESRKADLVDDRGFFTHGQLKPSLDALWKGYEKTLTKLNG